MPEADVILFPLHRVRLRLTDEEWAENIGAVVCGRGLTHEQVVAFIKHVEAFRFDHPMCAPSNAPWEELWERFEVEHLIREQA